MVHPIRILFVHPSNELYGSDIVLLQLVSGLDRSQFEPIVVLPSDIAYEGALSQALTRAGVTHYSIKMGVIRRRYLSLRGLFVYLFYLIHGIKQLRVLIRRHSIDIVHSNTSAILGGAFAARLCNVRHVWHIHEILDRPAWLGKLVYGLVRRYSTRIVTISAAVARTVAQRRKAVPIEVIYNGIDTDRFHPLVDGEAVRAGWNIGNQDVLVGMIGRISAGKGQDLFLDAAARASRQIPNLRFVSVGDPFVGNEALLSSLKRKAADLQLGEHVRFAAFSPDIPAIIRACDIVVVPSVVPEGLSLVALEAMASQRPVIATAHGGPLEIIASPDMGVLVEPGNPADLAAAIVALAANPHGRDRIGRNAREHVVDRFAVATFSQRFAELYRSVISPRQR